MSIEREEAARALQAAEAAADRSATAVGYERSSGYLILWGVVWVAMNVLGYVRAPYGNLLFPLLTLTGVVGSFFLGLRATRAGSANRGVQSLVIAAALALFAFGVGVVNPIRSFKTAESIMCLAVGAAYMVMGVSLGWRLTAVGAAVMVATIAVHVWGQAQFFLWMAACGGGGLILGGLWLRKA